MPRKTKENNNWFNCPNCGAELPRGAKFCRECGASEDSGWGEKADQWPGDSFGGYGEDDEFDYDEFVRREFPGQAGPGRRYQPKRVLMAVVVALLCVALLVWILQPWW